MKHQMDILYETNCEDKGKAEPREMQKTQSLLHQIMDDAVKVKNVLLLTCLAPFLYAAY